MSQSRLYNNANYDDDCYNLIDSIENNNGTELFYFDPESQLQFYSPKRIVYPYDPQLGRPRLPDYLNKWGRYRR